jgi:hypothetical protein
METRVGAAAVTVKATPGEAIAPCVATIDVEPAAEAVASPAEPLALLMLAIVVSVELQVTESVSTLVELSE